jgi:hypothetical protein
MKKGITRTLTDTGLFTNPLPYIHGLDSSPYGLRTGPDIFALRRRQRPRSSNEVG